MVYLKKCDSPIGTLTLAATETHMIGLWIDGQKHYCASIPDTAVWGEAPILLIAEQCLQHYFSGVDISKDIPPLMPMGTVFQQSVWKILLRIPYGQTITYGQIANILAKEKGLSRMSAQAVGNAVGRNPISIFIPCHRVLGSNGQLTGYAGGIDRKQFLIALEQHPKV